jgi:hypothetical protein
MNVDDVDGFEGFYIYAQPTPFFWGSFFLFRINPAISSTYLHWHLHWGLKADLFETKFDRPVKRT